MPSRTPVPAEHPLNIPRLDAQVHTLPNGLEILLREDPDHPLVSVQIWIRAGSIHEENWTGAGLAHCVEHMLFKGTHKRSAEDITKGIQERGGYVNAYTSFNRTVYWIDGLAEHAEAYLDILSDMARNTRLDPDELAREQDVIRREMAMDHDDPDSTLHHLMQSTAFRKHPLRHPIIGHREVFDQVSHADVAAFIARHYVPNNCFVVITGAIDSGKLFKAATRLLGDWPRRRFESIHLPSEPPLKGRREEFRAFPTDLTRVSLGWQAPGESHPDKAALDVIGFLLGSGRSSRLYQELREKRKLAHNVWAGAWCVQECGLFQVQAECDPPDAEATRAALFEVIETLQAEGPDAEELAKAVRATLNGQIRSLVTTKGQAASLGHSWLISGTLDLAARYLQAVRDLTPTRIRDIARHYLQPENVCVVTVGPQPKPTASGKKKSPVKKTAAHEIQRFELDGLTLLVRANPRLPLVSIRAQFLGGVLAETDETAGVTLASSQLLLKGTSSRAAADIQSELENLGGSLQCSADAHRRILGAEVMRGDEAAALDLLADLALRPSLPADDLELVKKHQLASIREEKEDPLTVALRRARAEIFSGKPFARTAHGTEASVNALDITACRRALTRTLNRENGVITVFGDIDPKTVRDQVAAAFHALPHGRPAYDPRKTLPSRAKPGRWEVPLEKEQAVLVIGHRTVDLHHPATPALKLIDEACSDMGSRLFNRIREELGLAYYVGAQAFSALSCGAFYFYLGTAPHQLDQAEAEMTSLIRDLAENGLTPDELERARVTWKSSWLRSQQGNGPLADITGWNHLNGLGHDHFERLPTLMAAVTPADIKAAARTYLHPRHAFTVRVTRAEAAGAKRKN